jgi:DNA-binding transcriptional ArsR family regulator
MANINAPTSLAKVSDLLQAISPEPRLEILLAIGDGEACVCHLEAVLGYRQAYISQHLMALREAGVLGTRRDGKYVFYRLEKVEIMEMVEMAARLAGFDVPAFAARVHLAKSSCECPHCSAELVTREIAN